MYDAPTAVLDHIDDRIAEIDDRPTEQFFTADLASLPLWPIIDHDQPLVMDDERLQSRPVIPAPQNWATDILTLERVLEGLLAL